MLCFREVLPSFFLQDELPPHHGHEEVPHGGGSGYGPPSPHFKVRRYNHLIYAGKIHTTFSQIRAKNMLAK